jgi:hypothetical protein
MINFPVNFQTEETKIMYSKHRIIFQIEMSQALVNGSSFKPIWTTYNAHFTEFELWFRFIFLLMAFGSAVALCQSLRKYSIEVIKNTFNILH